MEGPLQSSQPQSNPKQLTPKQAKFFGALLSLFGIVVSLIGLGVIPAQASQQNSPGFIIVCAGLIFILGGYAVINMYNSPQGPNQLSQKAKLTQDILALGIVGLLCVISAWVSFGPGTRQFTESSGLNSPGVSTSSQNGRIAFGVGFFLLLIFFIYGCKRVWQDFKNKQ